ncbi:hypothetical protein AB1M95_00210 [Sulfitobacter sp. LCG007]
MPLFSGSASAQNEGSPYTPQRIADCSQMIPESNKVRIDWDEIGSLKALESCIYSVAADLSDKEALNDFLIESGFDTLQIMLVDVAVMKNGYNQDGPGWRLSGTQPRTKIQMKMGLINSFLVHSLSVGIILDENQTPIKVSATFTRT